eukprot:GHRR01022536.1.p1 GENE.GHRR01022536.1~~GHRR01022536.1.p1  ORF type:complete len:203 (+),score=42.28 GHRR01022536.1:302-910(+)
MAPNAVQQHKTVLSSASRPKQIRRLKLPQRNFHRLRLGRVCVAAEGSAGEAQVAQLVAIDSVHQLDGDHQLGQKAATRRVQRRRQQLTYKVSAIAAASGVSALAVLATYYKFSHHLTGLEAAFPWKDMIGTLALVVGGVVGMEMWARWAHRALWHDFQPGWALHKSHHEPRIGPFEVGSLDAVQDGWVTCNSFAAALWLCAA